MRTLQCWSGKQRREIEDFLKQREVPQDLISQQLFRLTKSSVQAQSALKAVGFFAFTAEEESLRMLSEDVAAIVPQDTAVRVIPTPKKQPGRAACATIKEQRAEALEELPRGFYVCIAGRRKIRRLHLLRSCWMVPRVDFFVYAFLGAVMPQPGEYDEICKICSKSKGSDRRRQPDKKRILPQTLIVLSCGLSWNFDCFFLFFFSLCLSSRCGFLCLEERVRRIWQSSSSVWIGRSFLVFAKGEYDESGSPILRYGLEAILSFRKASTTNLVD